MTDYVQLKLLLNGIKTDEPMSLHTTFKIGGKSDLYYEAQNDADFIFAICLCQKFNVPYTLIGNGSNLLISDKGFRGLVIKLPKGDVHAVDNKLFVDCGVLLSYAAKYSVNKALSGLEWASGIPGTVGGAIAMNAGAYGGEIKNSLESVTVLKDSKIMTVYPTEKSMGYRKSEFTFPDCIVLSAVFKLSPDDGSAKARMEDYSKRRIEKQPLNFPSAGSTFKRPTGFFAGQLIEQAGLMGESIGGAKVSTKHAGFIINNGNATAKDVLSLIALIKKRVFESSGVMLEEEVKFLGEV